jgi:hypothetical protein
MPDELSFTTCASPHVAAYHLFGLARYSTQQEMDVGWQQLGVVVTWFKLVGMHHLLLIREMRCCEMDHRTSSGPDRTNTTNCSCTYSSYELFFVGRAVPPGNRRNIKSPRVNVPGLDLLPGLSGYFFVGAVPCVCRIVMRKVPWSVGFVSTQSRSKELCDAARPQNAGCIKNLFSAATEHGGPLANALILASRHKYGENFRIRRWFRVYEHCEHDHCEYRLA